MIQLIAGVDQRHVIADYLLTNQRRPQPADKYLRRLIPDLDDRPPGIYEPALTLRADYLRAGLRAAQQAYGGTEAYLCDGLALDIEVIDQLRKRIVAQPTD